MSVGFSDYIIIESSSKYEFKVEVEKKLRDGYSLVGGVNVTTPTAPISISYYYQSMAK